MCSGPAASDPKRVLITGGTGFVGANLVRRLLRDGHDVGLLGGPSRDPWRLVDVAREVRWLEGDLEAGAGLRGSVGGCLPPRGVFRRCPRDVFAAAPPPRRTRSL